LAFKKNTSLFSSSSLSLCEGYLNLLTMKLLILALNVWLVSADAIVEDRLEKSLLNTFPFNAQEVDLSLHSEDEDSQHLRQESLALPTLSNRQESLSLPALSSRHAYGPAQTIPAESAGKPVQDFQNIQNEIGIDNISAQKPNQSGKRCVDKVEMIEETQWDEVIKCDHSYDRRCHTSYTTTFEAQQEEDCEENYIKKCYIAYENFAFNETVEICRKPVVKDCDDDGAQPVCRTVYESECWTKQQEHEVEDDVVDCVTVQDEKCTDETVGYTTQTKCQQWPRQQCSVTKKTIKKYTPMTSCAKEPRELCAPTGCGFKEGAEECHEKVKTVVQEKPTEECDIEPHRICKHVTKLVPRLVPREECVDVPKEVCTRSKGNPHKVKKPVIKKWCYFPSAESGLA